MAEREKRKRNPLEDLRNIPPLDDSDPAGRIGREVERQHGARRSSERDPNAVNELSERIQSARQERRPTMQQISSENALIGQQIINTWLTDDFFDGTTHSSPGPTTRDRFLDSNPRVRTKPSNWFWQFAEDAGFTPTGVSPSGGFWLVKWLSGRDWKPGDVFVSSSVLTTADRYNLITHELLHEAVEANGGDRMYYTGEGGRRVELGYVRWFHEGTTELFSQELTRAHGMTPSYVSYPYEVMTCFLIQSILIEAYGETEGRRMMRDAYLNGDLSSIRNTVDGALGPGTFDRLMKMDRGIEGADEIFTLVRNKAGASLLSFSGTSVTLSWTENPIVQQAMRQLEQPQVQFPVHAFRGLREGLSGE